MSQIFGWVPVDSSADAATVVDGMAAALVVDQRQRVGRWVEPGLGIGVIEPPALDGEIDDLEPAATEDRRFLLWMAGEAFRNDDQALPLRDVAESRTRAFRRRLLERWLQKGPAAIGTLDGEYHIAVWDALERTLTLINDRFGGLPWYWGRTGRGLAFAGGVRGVLMAPDADPSPDLDALREAASFGGYRLGDRTNVASVRMVDGATVQTIRCDRRSTARYWTWRDIPAQPAAGMPEIVAMVHDRWQKAVACRTTDRARYGQTLSGGLDSRAILAEAARNRDWTAITYGVPGCDDAKYAERAAAAAGATWMFRELYLGDWLRTRTDHIQATDGLIELGDLMHLESVALQRERFDVHLSGYVGDAVSGPTFAGVRTADDVMAALPWYGASISLPYEAARARAQTLVDALDGAHPRFALFAHKLPQSTNRWTAAWRPWLRVRKPFVDYAFFDLCQGLTTSARVEGQLHERWLRHAYPACFATIPNQKTGMPVLTPRWRVQLDRVQRGARARLLRALPPGLRPAARMRSYHDNGRVWREPGTIDAITAPILRADALSASAFDTRALGELVDQWRTAAAAPAQVIGALYVFETYHAGLGPTLAAARARAGSFASARHLVRQ